MENLNHGTVEFEGKTLNLQEEAYPQYRSEKNNPNEWYYANAIDDNKKEYGVWWETLPEYQELCNKWATDEEECICNNEQTPEEEYACDWDNPTDICAEDEE